MTSRTDANDPAILRHFRRRRSISILAGRGLRCKRRTQELRMTFSRELANLKAGVALYFLTFNFCLIHRSPRMTI